ncbi:tripartite motif-containing protein 2-like [Mytilus edulis]|uniref:tripartite motif-containing protein 2-like n=1 Tax=Mytilus edulis TaxID=6550 RepID=UPI0039EE7E0B
MADSIFCVGCQRGKEDIIADSWCSDCSEQVCKTCARVHERMYPPHKIVPMKEIQELSSSLLTLSKNCENHPDQKIILYCCQHDTVICDSCVPVSHPNCNPIISVEKAAKNVKHSTAISDLEKRIGNLSQVTENILSRNETILEDLKTNRSKITKTVTEMKLKFIAHLDKLESNIHKDIDNKYEQCDETVSQIINSVQLSYDSLSAWKKDIISLKQYASEIHLFKAVKFLDAKTHQQELEIRDIQTATVPTLTYHPSGLESNIQNEHSDLGTIDIENVQAPISVLDIDQQCQFMVGEQRKLSLTNSFKTTRLGDGVRVYRGCFIPGNRLLLSQFSQNNLYVCELDGSNPKVIQVDYKIEHMSLYDNTHALVSSGYGGIQIIDLNLFKPGRKLKVRGHCYGITSVKDKIWVENQPKTLTIMNISGKVINTIKTTFDPCDICANKDGDVYCTDVTKSKVYFIAADGEEREICNSSDLKCPSGVTVDDHGDVYVAGYLSNNIHRISGDGQTQIVLTENDDIKKPGDLSFNFETRELLVINNDCETINIYQTY